MDRRIELDIAFTDKTFAEEECRLVIVKNQNVLYMANEQRLLPLAKALTTLGCEAHESVVKDRVIGRAAAMLLISFRVAVVITPLMSQGAASLLRKADIEVKADRVIPQILDQTGEKSCPMEAMVEGFEKPEEGAKHLLDFFHGIDLLPPYDLTRYEVAG